MVSFLKSITMSSNNSNEFVWDEKLVLEFVAKTIHSRLEWALIHDASAAPVPIQLSLKEFKASKTPKREEFEILSFKNGEEIYRLTDCAKGITEPYFRNKESGGYGATLSYALKEKSYSIYSVRRSDGIVFTVGDNVSNKHHSGGIIDSFKIKDDEMIVYFSMGLPCSLHWLSPLPLKKVLFTTEDGVEVFKGDDLHCVNIEEGFLMSRWFSVCDPPEKNESYSKRKYFSTKQAAEEYILLSKPCLSVNDILKISSDGDNSRLREFYIDDIKQLAKSKIK